MILILQLIRIIIILQLKKIKFQWIQHRFYQKFNLQLLLLVLAFVKWIKKLLVISSHISQNSYMRAYDDLNHF